MSRETVDLTADAGYTSYLWSTNAVTPTITATSGGVYTVTVTDAFTCQGTGTITVTDAPGPTPTITTVGSDTIVCDGQTVTLDGGAGFASYLWSSSSATSQGLVASTTGRYYLTVTDATGCQGIDSIDIVIASPLTSTMTETATQCNGGNDAEATVAVTGSVAPYSYTWNTHLLKQPLQQLV